MLAYRPNWTKPSAMTTLAGDLFADSRITGIRIRLARR